ncbi:hypothetical protein FH972_026870 [Carpinus fangiana]|uniref:Adhesin domain-containing protein n=1 Tax=Carpinus fangiana TaxID=176857 RepID=A0A5N6L5A8_9ROSI|nr:hypothetical protein FH972_026870 [Carpinus fangiana]
MASVHANPVVDSSVRQQDYNPRRDTKAPQPRDLEDDMSSIAASPRSMGTMDGEAGNGDIDSDVEEILPPPAYTPETTITYPTSSNAGQYGTMQNPEWVVDQSPIGEGDEETSMLVVRPGGQSYYVQRRRKGPTRRCCACCGFCCTPGVAKAIILAAAILLLVAGVVHEIKSSLSSDDKHKPLPGSSDPDDAIIPWPVCPDNLQPSHTRELSVDFSNLDSFHLEEGYFRQPPSHHFEGRHQIHGKVHVVSEPIQSTDVVAEISVASSEEAVAQAVEVVRVGEELRIDVADIFDIEPRDAYQTCTVINIVLRVAADLDRSSLSTFALAATHLSLELGKNLELPIRDNLALETVSGSIANSAQVVTTSPRTNVQTMSGAIIGTWPLRDNLQLDTLSGKIDIHYCPRPASDAVAFKDLPIANLTLTTVSGHILASPLAACLSGPNEADPASWPARRYSTAVQSTSGSIKGRFPIGEGASFSSGSGAQNLDIMPVAWLNDGRAALQHDEYLTHLETATISGGSWVRVYNSPNDSTLGDTLFNATRSSHKSMSGRMSISYPKQWAGTLEATSMSGKQKIQGDGLEIVERRHGWGTNHVKAVKRTGEAHGDSKSVIGGSTADIDTVSGSLDFSLWET